MNSPRRSGGRFLTVSCRLASALALMAAAGCVVVEPEVVVINNTAEQVLIRNPSFNGTVWNTTLAFGETTTPRQCMRGSGQVHFQKFDAHSYCRSQAGYGLVDSLCMCDSSWVSNDTDVIGMTPLWFNYRTVPAVEAGAGDFLLLEITLDNIEQDFSAPGPYGH